MGIQNFFTLPIQTPAPNGAVGTPQTALGGTPLGGLGFFEFILARLSETAQNTQETGKGTQEPLQSDNPLLDKNPKLSLADIIAANPEIKKEIDEFIEATQLGNDVELSQTLALNQQALDEVLKPVTDGNTITITPMVTGKDGQPLLTETLFLNPEISDEFFEPIISQLSGEIQKLMEQEKPVVITLNLTPEQITALQNQIAKTAEQEQPEWPADLSGFVVLVPPAPAAAPPANQPGTEPLNSPVAVIVPLTADQVGNAQKGIKTGAKPGADIAPQPFSTLAARLNALTTGNGDQTSFNFDSFEGELQSLQNGPKADKTIPNMLTGAPNTPPPATKPAATPNLAFLQAWQFNPSGGSLFASFETTQDMLNHHGLNTTSTGQTSLTGMTNLVTQAQSAATPHPALQLIAVNIQKNFAQGQDKTLMLQLDPPELGRVEIRMTFGKDKTMKAHVIAEKPETYLMLQRDSQTLERALESAGVDSDGGLSFELAGQDQNFGNDQDQNGGHNNNGAGANDNEPEIIQSTMMWHVDSQTGHTRYNLLV